MLAESGRGGSRSGKVPRLKQMIAEAVSSQPAGTRLPSMRELARLLHTTVVTAQRAVTELADEGILRCQPRSGVFVGSPAAAPPAAEMPCDRENLSAAFTTRFTFGSDSGMPFQQNFWRGVTRPFRARYPHAIPELQFAPATSAVYESCDVYEWSGWRAFRRPLGEAALPLDGSVSGNLPVPARAGCLVPLYFRTHFTFVNRSWLDSRGLPAPEFRTFAGQLEYFTGMRKAMVGLDAPALPFSDQQPVTLLGAALADFLALVREPDARREDALAARIAAVAAMCSLQLRDSEIDHRQLNFARNEFMSGRAPFFFGYSVDLWEFSHVRLPFAMEAYPTLCADDALFKWPMVGVVNRESKHPVESLRLLNFLLEEASQRKLVGTGALSERVPDALPPCVPPRAGWLSAVFARSYPFYLTDPDSLYLATNILNGEIFRAVLDSSSPTAALRQALQLGHSYLTMPR